MGRPIKRWELVELPITANSTATIWKFPDIPQLRDDVTQDIIIRGIEVFGVQAVPLAPSGNAVATTAFLAASFLTLYVQDKNSEEQSINQIPLPKLNAMFGPTATGTSTQEFEPTEFQDLKIVWNKSFISTPGAYGGGTFTAFSFLFGVSYKRLLPGEWEKITANIPQGM